MSRTRYIAQAGVIAAVYAMLTLLTMQFLGGLAWGPIQLRVSEAFTVIALFTPAAVPGLTIGSVVSNALNPTAIWPLAGLDVVFGSLGTLLGAIWMRRFRARPALALAGPVISNALIVPAYLPVMLAGLGFYTVPFFGVNLDGDWLAMYVFGVIAVGIGEAIVVYGVGWPLMVTLKRIGIAGFIDPKG
jgi:uncharacterized membrane protein